MSSYLPINVYFNVRHIQLPSALRSRDDFGYQFSMGDKFPALHDSHDGCLCLKRSIRCHSFVGFLVFLLGLF